MPNLYQSLILLFSPLTFRAFFSDQRSTSKILTNRYYITKRRLKCVLSVTDNRERENFCRGSSFQQKIIFNFSLFNVVKKITSVLCMFNRVIFKALGSECYCKIVFLEQQTNICWLKYGLICFYDFNLRNIDIDQYDVQTKQTERYFSPKMGHFGTTKQQLTKIRLGQFEIQCPHMQENVYFCTL